MKVFVRRKDEPLVQPVRITQVINPFFARVEQPGGRIETVSTRALSPNHSPKDRNLDAGHEGYPTDSLEHTPRFEATEAATEGTSGEDDSDQAIHRPVRQRRPPDFYQSKW